MVRLPGLIARPRPGFPIVPSSNWDGWEAAVPSDLAGDIAHVPGQEHAKRALKAAAAGGHNLLMM